MAVFSISKTQTCGVVLKLTPKSQLVPTWVPDAPMRRDEARVMNWSLVPVVAIVIRA